MTEARPATSGGRALRCPSVRSAEAICFDGAPQLRPLALTPNYARRWLTERSDAEHVRRFAVHRRVEALLRFGADADWRDEVDDAEHHVRETKGV